MTDKSESIRTLPAAEVLPVLIYRDVGMAARWLCGSFGFTFRWRVGQHRAQVGVGSSAIVLTEPRAEADPRSGGCGAVLVQISDVDTHCAHARAAGAHILEEPTDFPYGQRQYVAEDPEGHRWTFTQTISDLKPAEWGAQTTL